MSLVFALGLAVVFGMQACSTDSSGPSNTPFSVSPDSAALLPGAFVQLSAPGAPGAVTWSSSDNRIATVVDITGFVTAVAPGSALITATAGGQSAQARIVVLTPPAIGLSNASLQFSATAGQGNPPPQTVNVTNSGGETLTGLAVGAIQYGPGQPSGWLNATFNTTTAPATLSFQATTGALPPGSYTASVPITASGASNSPQFIAATFVVGAPPAIGVSASTAAFNATQGAANPASQTINVTNIGGATLSGLAAAITYAAGQPSGWLAATLSSTAAPANLVLQPTVGSLTPGTYSATVALSSNVPGVAAVPIAVSFTVAARPSIVLSGTSASFNVIAGGANPAAQTINITNGGGGTLSGLSSAITFTAGQPTGWLTATLDQTTAPAAVTLQPIIAGLAAGTYTATVAIAAPGADNSPRNIAVTLTVAPATSLAVNPTSVTFNALVGGGNPASQNVAVTATGGTASGLSTSITFTAGQPSGWLTATLSGTTAPATLTLQPNTAGLQTGTFNATVTVSSNTPGFASRTVTVTLVVGAPPPLIGLGTSSATFNATVGGANPGAQFISVINNGGGTLSGLALSVTYGAGQPSGWLTAALGSTTAPTTLSLQAATGGLAAGSYNATVTITSPVATNSPVTLPVTFNVNPSGVLVLNPTSVTFNAVTGGASPAAQNVSVATSSGTAAGLSAAITYGAGQPTGWLAANLSGGTTPATLALQPTTGALVPGTYTATVSVSSTTAGFTPRSVSVTFVVSQPPPRIALSATSRTFTATAGGGNPASQTVNVTNSGGGTLSGLATSITYQAGQPAGWLTASISPTTAPAVVTVQPATGSLAAGTYNATVAVTSAVAANSPQTFAVTFTVSPGTPPTLVLSPTTLNFTATRNQANPTSQGVTVSSTGGTASGLNISAGLPSWLTATLNGTSTNTTMTVQPITGSLAPGTYTATITVNSTTSGVTSKTVTVNFTVLVSYSLDVHPIWAAASCTGCHFSGGSAPNLSGTSATTRSALNGSSANAACGPYVVAGNASASCLVKRITGTITPTMGVPPNGNLSTAQRNTIILWINQGAPNN